MIAAASTFATRRLVIGTAALSRTMMSWMSLTPELTRKPEDRSTCPAATSEKAFDLLAERKRADTGDPG